MFSKQQYSYSNISVVKTVICKRDPSTTEYEKLLVNLAS